MDTTHLGAGSTVDESEILSRIPGRIPGRLFAALVVLVLLGLGGFAQGLTSAPQRAWQAYLVNFLFFTGLAAAGVIFGVVMQLAKGHWGKSLLRIAQGFGLFLPVSYVLFLLLFFGSDYIFPWIENPVNHEGHPLPGSWYSVNALWTRGAIFLLLLYIACFAFIYYSLRPDMAAATDHLQGWRRRLTAWISRGWRGDEDEAARSRRILARLSPILMLGYVIIISGMAIDLIMSLEPGWISVLFPAYFFVGAWLSALAGLAVMAALFRRYMGLDYFASNQWHDLGKLIFAFSIFWAYLWFSQYLVIWYGNLPRETLFVKTRTEAPWTLLSIAFFVMIFALPFVLLLPQKIKTVPPYLASVSGIILVGFWLERFNMVVPSIWHAGSVPLGLTELSITLGFLGLFGLCYAVYASTFPLVPIRESLIVGKARTGPY